MNILRRKHTHLNFSAVQLLCEPDSSLNVSERIHTLFNLQCSAILVRTFFGLANIPGRIHTLFNF